MVPCMTAKSVKFAYPESLWELSHEKNTPRYTNVYGAEEGRIICSIEIDIRLIGCKNHIHSCQGYTGYERI